VRATLKTCCLVGLVIATPAAAQDGAAQMTSPRISSADVDWGAVRTALADFDTLASPGGGASAPDALSSLNTATAKVFAKIASSPVPVLLPFDTGAFLRDDAQGAAGDTSKYLSGFQTAILFFPGPSGYDASLSLRPQDAHGLDLTFAKPVEVQISGSTLLYELDGPPLPDGTAAPQLDSQFPGIRRSLLESHLRYTFVRFGVPYAVSIVCFDGPSSARRLSCRDADKVALRFLKALNVAGGSPQTNDASLAQHPIERPSNTSPDFTYYAPGDIIPGSGVHGQTGRADFSVYGNIRFPLAQAPAYANSQAFMNWGNCDLSGRVTLGGRGDSATYRCKVNDKPLVNDESKNYAYPWRDNFCEHRGYEVGQCPAGVGHQGQDIRAGHCLERTEGADRCEPYQEDVVAVSDGVLMRTAGDLALYLVVDKPGEHVRFRYLHMNPFMLDAGGMVSGRAVVEGEVLGSVGDYGRAEDGTSTHLHFDAQVLTRAGWVFVNPYMTLVAAYERLIGARGLLVTDAMLAAAPASEPDGQGDPNSAGITASKLAETPKSSASDAIVAPGIAAESRQVKGEDELVSAAHCTTHFVKGHRRRICRSDVAGARERERHIRSVDSGVSEQGRRARHHGRYVHARHAGASS
jgi:murein DD-endopeptidase MepM/ murein hydrolase activator NlpD